VAGRHTTICCSAVALIALATTITHAQTTIAPPRNVKQTRAADDKTPLSLFPVSPIWTLVLNNALTAPPAFHDNLALFALEGEQLAAYDLERGSRLWLSNIATMVEPAIGADLVFVVTDESLVALSRAAGAVAWSKPFDDELSVAPVVDGDRLLLSAASGAVIALRTADGGELWRQQLPRGSSSRPAFSATRIFVPTADGFVVALDAANGGVLWRRRLGGVGHDILEDHDRLFLGAQDRYFYCLNAKDGEVEWRWATGADAIGLPVVDDKTVYFVSLDNILRGLNRGSGVQRWKTPLSFRPIAGPLKYAETLVVAGTAPQLQANSTRDGKLLGRYTAPVELSAPPYLYTDRSHVFPVLTTITSDIIGHATVTGTTRDIEPENSPPAPLPNAEKVIDVPDMPRPVDVVSGLPGLTPVVPAAGP
jgi:outer membrane protein assembly factor BamB